MTDRLYRPPTSEWIDQARSDMNPPNGFGTITERKHGPPSLTLPGPVEQGVTIHIVQFEWVLYDDLWSVPVSFTVERCEPFGVMVNGCHRTRYRVTPGRVEWHNPPLTELPCSLHPLCENPACRRLVPALSPGELR